MNIEELHQKNFEQIKSKRLLLRPLSRNDSKEMFEYTKENQVFYYIKRNAHHDISETRKFIDDVLQGYKNNNEFIWGIEKEKCLIGTIRIFNIDLNLMQGEISYMLNPKYQTQGYMTEAVKILINYSFYKLMLDRIWARCDEENTASEAVMQKVGMNYVSCIENYIEINNTMRNFKVYKIDKQML